MSREFTDQIECPYCECIFEDSWEFDDNDGDEIECIDCDKKFILGTHHSVSYSTYRIDCEEIEKTHQWGDSNCRHIDQDTCDRWNAKAFCHKTDHKPHNMWIRNCKNCDQSEYKEMPLNEECPFNEHPGLVKK